MPCSESLAALVQFWGIQGRALPRQKAKVRNFNLGALLALSHAAFVQLTTYGCPLRAYTMPPLEFCSAKLPSPNRFAVWAAQGIVGAHRPLGSVRSRSEAQGMERSGTPQSPVPAPGETKAPR